MSDATDALAEKAYAAAFTCEPPSGQKWAYVRVGDLRALARDAYDLAQADLAAAQAVIEQVREWLVKWGAWQSDELMSILIQSSSSALAAHDAEVAAKESEAAILDKLAALSPHWKRKELRDRAQALRDGQETT